MKDEIKLALAFAMEGVEKALKKYEDEIIKEESNYLKMTQALLEIKTQASFFIGFIKKTKILDKEEK